MGGGPPADLVSPVFFPLTQRSNATIATPLSERRERANATTWVLKAFIAGSDLLHAKQEHWECLLLAFRAAIRARIPSLATFLGNLRSTGRVGNVDECAESGIPMPVFRFWMSLFCDNFILQVIRKHQWGIKSVVEHFFANTVIIFNCFAFSMFTTL